MANQLELSDNAAAPRTLLDQLQSIAELNKPRAIRPPRGASVRLVGRMSGVGFSQAQWLIEREGQYIQITELLYRIVEQADGQRTLQEIAEAVTSCTEWMVSAEDVDQLITSKLAPLGIIGGKPAEKNESTSPLDLSIRFKTISPRFITPATRFLQFLCVPPVISVVLASSAAVQWWLYRSHGIARGFQDAIYTPGGLLLAIFIVLLGAAFHELGHASALRYHGGEVGGIGVGVYLLYPVFYTDVTDCYRLSRRARLGVDLGGIYFHLIFALLLFGTFVLTHKELFLFSIFLVDFEIIRQFIPLIRLDGYWALTDLTGVPDLFSQTLPFVKSLLPSAGLEGNALPTLKKWVAAVYVTYLVVTFPLLGYLFVMMLVKFPELLLTTWSALHTQVSTLLALGVVRNPGATFLVSFQILLLLVPIVGTVYLVWAMVKGPLSSFVDWTSRTRRNMAVGLAGAAVVCGVAAAVVILPPSTLFRRAKSSAEPVSIVSDTQRATTTANTLSANLEGSLGSDHFTGKVLLKRPNLARIEINGSGSLGRLLVVSDGKTVTTYFQDDNEYVQATPGAHGERIDAFVTEQIADFFQPELLSKRPNIKFIGRQTADGQEYDVVAYESPTQFVRYFVSPKDKLVHRVVRGKDSNQPTAWATMVNVQIDAPIEPAAFAWHLPSSARPAQMPANLAVPVQK